MKFDEDVFPILEYIKNHPNPEDTREYAFQHAILYYNSKKYFEAHEIWEFQWKKESGDSKLFIQALIQISVAMNKLFVNVNLTGALSQSKLALEKIKHLAANKDLPEKTKKFLENLIANLNLLNHLLENGLEYTTYLPPKISEETFSYFGGTL